MQTKIKAFRPDNHKGCLVQYLGRDYSLGLARKAYYCATHRVAFYKMLRAKKT